jgi:hypothetical protein
MSWKIQLVLAPSWLSFCFLTTTCSCDHDILPYPKPVESANQGPKPLKPWTKINPSSFKLFLSSICNSNNNNKNKKLGRAAVAHACNPSYPGGRDQEDHCSKPAWRNSSVRPCLKKPFTTIGLMEWLKVKALSSSPSTTKKNKTPKNPKNLSTEAPVLFTCIPVNFFLLVLRILQVNRFRNELIPVVLFQVYFAHQIASLNLPCLSCSML